MASAMMPTGVSSTCMSALPAPTPTAVSTAPSTTEAIMTVDTPDFRSR